MAIRVVIIDDEKLARVRLTRLLQKYAEIEIVGEAENGRLGLELISTIRPDVIFLDIKMPLMSGFEMLGEMEKSPYVIFTTAYNEYALQAFEENTIDYLMKPIAEERLARAIRKATNILQGEKSWQIDINRVLKSITKKEQQLTRFSVKAGNKIALIPSDDVQFFCAEDKYTFLHTAESEFIVDFSLKDLENRLPAEIFQRVHRSFIINLNYIKAIHKWFGGKLQLEMKNGKEIIVSRSYIRAFKEKINLP